MKRPVGVILASIVLGCFAALQLLAAALYILLAFTIRHGLPVPTQPAMPTGALLTGIMIFTSFFFAILAAWAIFTLVGLLRLRNWTVEEKSEEESGKGEKGAGDAEEGSKEEEAGEDDDGGGDVGEAASIVLYLGFAVASALIGIGLLRLRNGARLGVYALSAVGIINFLILLTPWGQTRYTAYQQSLSVTMHFPGVPPPAYLPFNTHALTLFMAVFCLLFYGVQIWLIERHRAAFLAPPPRLTPTLNLTNS